MPGVMQYTHLSIILNEMH